MTNKLKFTPDIMTASGNWFDFINPEKSVIDINDIAHALSMICRFTGHCREFYSVAQHCVHVSHLVPPEIAFIGLMHDAAEAYIGDIAAPLKQLLPDYKAIEHRVESAVMAHFGISLPLPGAIKIADMVALVTEKRDLMVGKRWAAEASFDPDPEVIVPWSADLARHMFLARFHHLQAK